MSNTYVKTNWANGDTLSAERFNHMETGVDSIVNNGIGVVYDQDDNDSHTLDKNFMQILEMLENGQLVAIKSGMELLGFINQYDSDNLCVYTTFNSSVYYATSPYGILSRVLDA